MVSSSLAMGMSVKLLNSAMAFRTARLAAALLAWAPQSPSPVSRMWTWGVRCIGVAPGRVLLF